MRWRLTTPGTERPSTWLILSAHAALATVRDRSNAYTKKEQATADENAEREQAALSGGGGSLGVGMSYPINEHLSVGGYYRMTLQVSASSADDARDLTSWTAGQAGFLFELTGARSTKDQTSATSD